MPDSSKRNESSARGPWFVDQSLCEGCRECIPFAPQIIKWDVDSLAYFSRQPKGEKEEVNCVKALEACPRLAVGKED